MFLKRKFPIFILVVIAAITILQVFYIKKLKFNYDFESYFPIADPEVDYLFEFRKKFENDTDFLLIGIENKRGVFNEVFIKKIDSLTGDLQKLSGTRKIISPTNIKNPIISGFGMMEIPYLHVMEPAKYKNDSINIFQTNELVGNIFSNKSPSVNILIKTTPDINKMAGDSLLAGVNSALEKYRFDAVHVGGKIRASHAYVEKMKLELGVFMLASTILISIFLFIAYRSAWGIFIPLITVILSIAWTLGVMSMAGKNLDVLTVLLPPILFVVAMSDMTHFLSKYLEELRHGHPKQQAILISLKEVGLATFITAVTTAIGFITLINSNIRPIRDFGIYTSIGVFISYILAFTVLPSLLLLLKEPKIAKYANEELFWHKTLQKMLLKIFRNKKTILYTSIFIIACSIYFITKIEINSTILDDISKRDPLRKDVIFFEENFGGVRPFEMVITIDKSSDVFDYTVLQDLAHLEEYLSLTYGVNNIVSPLTIVKSVHKASNGGLPAYYTLPAEDAYPQLKKRVAAFVKRPEVKAYIAKDGREIRISGKVKDVGSKYIAIKNEKLRAFVRHSFRSDQYTYHLTGSSVLIDKNNEYLARSLIEDLFIAIITIAVIIGLLFRSFRMILIALLPNLIPLAVIGGIMGIFDINLKASTSIIFSIAFGIAVDDSIHFLSRLKLELSYGKSLLYALKRTYISTGKAMVVTSLILISGFLTLMLSSFQGTFYTGFLISLTLLIAIIADLILLPVLLILFYNKKKQ